MDRPSAPSASDTVTQFIDHQRLSSRPRTVYEYERLLNNHFLPKLGSRPLDRITTADVLAITDGLLETPAEAIHVHATVKRLFSWAVQRRLIAASRLAGLPLPAKISARERVLTDDELKRVYLAAQDMGFPFGFILLICVHTGMRRTEVGSLKWSYIAPDFHHAAWRDHQKWRSAPASQPHQRERPAHSEDGL